MEDNKAVIASSRFIGMKQSKSNSIKKSVRPERVEGSKNGFLNPLIILTPLWFDRLTTNGSLLTLSRMACLHVMLSS
jgi:hypothetical protein